MKEMEHLQEENQVKLSQHYLAYVDILGVKNLINSDDSEKYLNLIKKMYDEVFEMIEENCKSLWQYNHYDIRAKVKIFSDNIVIAIPKDGYLGDSLKQIRTLYLLIFVSFFQIIALRHSFLLRGSVVLDNLFMDDTFIYGQALTKAYNLETNVAIYPRIIINPSDIKSFLCSDTGERIIEKDDANIYYINPFECCYIYSNEKELLPSWLNSIKEILLTKLSSKDNKINQKNCWFINMFNRFCDKYEQKECKIDLSKYPYDPHEVEVRYTGEARKWFKNKVQ